MIPNYNFITGGSFVCLDSDPEWKPTRAKLVTGSAVATVMGLNPFQSREQLANIIQGYEIDDFQGNNKTWWGSFSEKHNMAAFSTITGLRTEPHNGLYVSSACPWLGATLDGFVWRTGDERPLETLPLTGLSTGWWRRFQDALEGVEGVGLVEMKQTSRVGDWSYKVPEYYWVQAQSEMFVTGLPWAVVVAKIGADDMRMHLVLADEDFVSNMVEQTRAFAVEVGILKEI